MVDLLPGLAQDTWTAEDTVGGQGRGVFEKSGTHKWRVRLIIQIADGPLLLTDGEISLEGRSYTGTIHQWE